MKMKCLHCLNEDNLKFAATRSGAICLVCFEKSIERTAETAADIAQLEIQKHLTRGTGGNNRRFTNAYRAMINKSAFLDSLPDKTEAQNNFSLGFKEALNTFEKESRV
jgi:hypothetical protein